MKLSKRISLVYLLLMTCTAGPAFATPITVTFTGDNLITGGGLCWDSDCDSWDAWGDFGPVSNLGNWRSSDTVVLDLLPGEYWFTWGVSNYGTGSPSNPAGFLAEILWDGFTNASSGGWEVSSDLFNWTGATTYGYNGAANIWTNVNGGAVSGISSGAEWLWSSENFQIEMDSLAYFRTSITIDSVLAQSDVLPAQALPEPTSLALLGIGLIGLGISQRRRRVND